MNRTQEQEVQWLLDEKYGGERTTEAEKDIARLEKGEHVDYVIGWVDFLGCRIDLSLRPLIPRQETEYWAEKAINDIHAECDQYNGTGFRYIRALDMFAGSGCIGIAVLKYVPDAIVDFIEKDEKLLKQIQLNADLNKIDSGRYSIIESDIFAKVSGNYDFILANPPYIAKSKKQDIQESVLRNDPHDALFGGEDGLLYITKFLERAERYLKPGGTIYMEFDDSQNDKIDELIRSFEYESFKFHKDQYGKWRYVVISL